jgi:hypothetical protein
LSHATDVRAARQLNSRVRVRLVELLRQLLQRVRLGPGALRVWCVVCATETSHQAAAKRHKQTIDTKTPQEKQHEAKQHEAGKSFAGNGQFHSC